MNGAPGPSLPPIGSIPGYAQAEQLRRAGRYAEAARAFQTLWRRFPKDWRLAHLAGHCALIAGQPAQALPLLKSSLMLNPGVNHARIDLAGALRGLERYDQARAALDEAIRLNPGDRRALCAKGELCLFTGDRAGAADAAKALFQSPPEDPSVATSMLKLSKLVDRRDDAIAWARGFLDAPAPMPPRPRAEMLFALTSVLDATGAYDEAFAAACEANALIRPPYDREEGERRMRRFMSAWTRDLLERAPHAAMPNENLVFIVGMPRSGTSLVEQILAAHPDVVPGGERVVIPTLAQQLAARLQQEGVSPEQAPEALIRQDRLDELSAKLAASLPPAARGAKRFTDKLPGNYQHLGFIQLIAPGARVVALKRDPRDVAISNFFHLFAHEMPNTHDLRDLAWFQSSVDRSMDKWKRILRLPILEVVYEELVADLEGVSRKLIEFVGLEWDDACLNFHTSERIVATASNEQVRQPIYTSSLARWKRYERHLTPFTQTLAQYTESF